MISGGRMGIVDLSFMSTIKWSLAYPVAFQLAKVELSTRGVSAMTPTKIPTGKYYWGLGASLLTLLIGGWLILAPFALGYQNGNSGSWTAMPQNDVWAGCGVVLVSL